MLPSYCASPISGMGTTLALMGAYTLAGALVQHPPKTTNPSTSTNINLSPALSQYESLMRPTVIKAQKLAPGMPWLINPETSWGIWILRTLGWSIQMSGLVTLLHKWKGPPANGVPVAEYGFRELEDRGCVRR